MNLNQKTDIRLDRTDVIDLIHEMKSLFDVAKNISGVSDHPFEEWKKTCHSIQRQIAEDILRIAVVGSIKSGKSTFVNALLGDDYLKRGAGVVTSIVTRIRRGQNLKATLFVKSWEEINREMTTAMHLLPPISDQFLRGKFDIRQEAHRTSLNQMLNSLSSDLLIQNDARNVNIMLLSSYLKGYDRIKDLLSSGTLIRTYEDQEFGIHQDYTGDETLSVFLKDIELTVTDGIQPYVELADCQGSDSPNPLHLAMIEDYLSVTHMIIYVISSRIGIRQADIRFLNLIRKMGIIDNIIFIVNVDFNEHPSLENLNAQIHRIKEELSIIKPDPELYAFSALYTLFKDRKDEISEKDRLRLVQWETEKQFIDFSEIERLKFIESLNKVLSHNRQILLLKNHLERIAVVCSGVEHWVRIHKELYNRDVSTIRHMIEKVSQHHAKIATVQEMIKSTLDGASDKMKRELKKNTDRFFDPKSGKIIPQLMEFIHRYQPSFDNPANQLLDFSKDVYMTFQEFKQALDMFIAESIHPEVMGFNREQEKHIMFQLESLIEPYIGMMWDAMSEYNRQMEQLGIPTVPIQRDQINVPNIDVIKGDFQLQPPSATELMQYSNRIRSEAIMKLGVYSITGFLKKLLKRKPRDKWQERKMALEDSLNRIKRETEHSIMFHFKDYQENYKFQYIFKLVDAATGHVFHLMMHRFQMYVTNLDTMKQIVNRSQADKQNSFQALSAIESGCNHIMVKLAHIRKRFLNHDE